MDARQGQLRWRSFRFLSVRGVLPGYGCPALRAARINTVMEIVRLFAGDHKSWRSWSPRSVWSGYKLWRDRSDQHKNGALATTRLRGDRGIVFSWVTSSGARSALSSAR